MAFSSVSLFQSLTVRPWRTQTRQTKNSSTLAQAMKPQQPAFSEQEKTILNGYQALLQNNQLASPSAVDHMQKLCQEHIYSPMAEQGPVGSQWGEHISVLASVSQRHFGYVRYEKGLKRYTITSYKDRLLKLLLNPKIRSLRQAHNILEREGYPSHLGMRQYAVSTCGTLKKSCLDGWKKDTPKNRFVLLLGYAHYKEPGAAKADGLQQSAYVLHETFQVPYQQIQLCPNVTKPKIEKQLQKLGKQLEKAQETGEPLEVLISYDGHGAYRGFPRLSSIYRLKEGEAQGYVSMADGKILTQQELKDMIQRHLPEVDITLIINACHSGSWIA